MWKILFSLILITGASSAVHATQPTIGGGGGGPYVPSVPRDACWVDEPNYEAYLLGSEVIGQYGIVAEIANDFTVADSMALCVIRWWGGYFNYSPGDPHVTSFDLRIYEDKGSCEPDTAPVHEFILPDNCYETFVHQQQDPYQPIYEYSAYVVLGLPSGHYWLSVQAGDHDFPPQWGRLGAEVTEGCETIYRCAYFSYPDWVSATDIGYAGYEASQLLICAPCPPRPRACCRPDGSCRLVPPIDCVEAGGIPLEPASLCNPNPCPQPQEGACCLPSPNFGACRVETPAGCDSAGGTWDGLPACSPNPCPQDILLGAPCPPDGSDRFDKAYAAFLFDAPGDPFGPRPILASGPTTVVRRPRQFRETGLCEIETEFVEITMTGVYNPNCFEPWYERPVTITLATEPAPPSVGLLTSAEALGDPAWPVVSVFDAHLIIAIDGLGDFTHAVPDLSCILYDDNLWGEQPCTTAEEAYLVPTGDHLYIPCDLDAVGKDGLRDAPYGCCVLEPGNLLLTFERICDLLDGTYIKDAVRCDSCYVESVTAESGDERTKIGFAVPNPSAGPVRIAFGLSGDAEFRVDLCDAGGRLVRSFDLGTMEAGPHEFVWDGNDENGREVAAGVYFIRMRAGAAKSTNRIVVMR